jgi:endonuclease I
MECRRPCFSNEINRNSILEGVQGNRNPFIDNPAFATAIWGGPGTKIDLMVVQK